MQFLHKPEAGVSWIQFPNDAATQCRWAAWQQPEGVHLRLQRSCQLGFGTPQKAPQRPTGEQHIPQPLRKEEMYFCPVMHPAADCPAGL